MLIAAHRQHKRCRIELPDYHHLICSVLIKFLWNTVLIINMCFCDQWEFACKCFKWGPFRQHCSKEYRTGETCGMKLVMNRHQSAEKCKICTKIDTKERSIAREEERLRHWRLRYGEQQILSTGETRTHRISRAECVEKEAPIQEARIQKMKMDVIVLRDILQTR